MILLRESQAPVVCLMDMKLEWHIDLFLVYALNMFKEIHMIYMLKRAFKFVLSL